MQNPPALGLTGRTVIVTGAAGGIGSAVVRMAVANGMNVLAVDVARDRLDAVVGTIAPPEAVAAYVADLAETSAIPAIVEAAVDRFGSIHGLVHAAAILRRQMEITEITEADWDVQVNVNQRGSWFLGREVAETLRRQGDGGSIVLFASAGAFTGGLGGSWVYSSTKGAVVTMVRGFARTYAPHGIRVNAISPGTTNTEMLTRDLPSERLDAINAMVPMKRVAEPEEMATVALFLLSNWASYVAGVTLDVDGAMMTR